jgi:hypothetical protein
VSLKPAIATPNMEDYKVSNLGISSVPHGILQPRSSRAKGMITA